MPPDLLRQLLDHHKHQSFAKSRRGKLRRITRRFVIRNK